MMQHEKADTVNAARDRMKQESAAEWVDTSKLTPWRDNPRKNDGEAVDAVADSIKRFGFASPIIARMDGEVIAGHTRLKAALKLGLDRVLVRYMDLDPADAKLLALADNRVGEIADWDDDRLSDILNELQAEGVNIDGLGWSDDELAEIMALGEEMPEEEGTPDEIDPDAVVYSEPGQVYQLGPHRLICGDCRELETVSALMDGQEINVAFTSPPYASQRKYDESSGFKPIKPDAYVDWFEAVQANVRAHLAGDGSWFVNIKEHCDDGQRSLYVKDLTLAHVRQWGWRFVDEFCWARSAMPMQMKHAVRFKNEWEPVLFFAQDAPKFRPDNVTQIAMTVPDRHSKRAKTRTGSGFQTGFGADCGDSSYPSNLLWLSKDGANIENHEAVFPVGLPSFFIKAYSDPSDAIFDPFLGSGTTLIAAAKEGRVCYGVEISPGYCDIIRRRWTAYAKQAGLDAGTGALE
jgi:DNA modification methylase